MRVKKELLYVVSWVKDISVQGKRCVFANSRESRFAAQPESLIIKLLSVVYVPAGEFAHALILVALLAV